MLHVSILNLSPVEPWPGEPMIVHRRMCPYAHTITWKNHHNTGERLLENILKLAPDVASILSSATKLGELIKG
jgi:hypothetical protein